jgi:hypothetical protein
MVSDVGGCRYGKQARIYRVPRRPRGSEAREAHRRNASRQRSGNKEDTGRLRQNSRRLKSIDAKSQVAQSKLHKTILPECVITLTMTLGAGDRTVSLSDELLPLLAARAVTDPDAARLLEIFTRADEISSEHPPERINDVEIPKL